MFTWTASHYPHSKKIILNQLPARILVQGRNSDTSSSRANFEPRFAIWRHYSYLPNRATIADTIVYCCKRLKGLPGTQGRKWNHFTESKVSGPKTDGPANYLRSLPSKTSYPRLLVPGPHMLPGTLLGKLMGTVLLKP